MYHAILQKALGYYGIKGTNRAWFRSYLTIHESDLRNTTCGVPHSSFYKYTGNKTARSIGLMYKAKPFLDKDSLLSLYFSYIHSCINHANLAWASTHKTNLKKIHSQQKHAFRIVYK